MTHPYTPRLKNQETSQEEDCLVLLDNLAVKEQEVDTAKLVANMTLGKDEGKEDDMSYWDDFPALRKRKL